MRLEEVIGHRLRAERERQGMTLKAMGQELETYLGKPWTPQAVWQAERGQRDFGAAQLLALALVLEIPVAQLLAPLEGDQLMTLPNGYALSAKDVERLFMAVAAPDGAELIDQEIALERTAAEISDALGQLTNARAQVYVVADQLMTLVKKAELSPRVLARYEAAKGERPTTEGD